MPDTQKKKQRKTVCFREDERYAISAFRCKAKESGNSRLSREFKENTKCFLPE
jgi:hypothetical protein